MEIEDSFCLIEYTDSSKRQIHAQWFIAFVVNIFLITNVIVAGEISFDARADIVTANVGATSSKVILEIDGFDVSQLSERNNSSISYKPIPHLTPGTHFIRISQVVGDDSEVLHEEEVEISAIAGVHGAYIDYASSLNATTLVSSTVSNPDTVLYKSSSLNLNSGVSVGATAIQANSESVYSNAGLLGPGTREFDLASYGLSASRAFGSIEALARLGDSAVGFSSLILDNTFSRGASLDIFGIGGHVHLGTFLLNPSSSFGTHNITGIDNPDNRISGAFFNSSPWGNKLSLKGAYYDGRRTDNSFTSSFVNDFTAGDGWSVAAVSTLIDNSLNSSFEYAQSTYDFDGANVGLPALSDKALNVKTAWLALDTVLEDGASAWLELGAGYDSIGSDFYSIANPNLAADIQKSKLSASAGIGSLFIDVAILQESDNVNNFPGLETNVFNGFISEFFYQNQEAGGLAYALAFSIEDFGLTGRPLGFSPAYEVDSHSFYSSFEVKGVKQKYEWVASQAYSNLRDNISPANNYDDYVTNIGIAINSAEHINLNLGMQYQVSDLGYDTERSFSPTASINGKFWRERLIFGFAYNGYVSDSSYNADTHAFNSSISWIVLKPKDNFPGLNFNLNYSDFRDISAFLPKTKQLRATLTIGHSRSFP